MSSADEQKKEEKVETVVDVENFDFTNDLFRKTYGSATIGDAHARTTKMTEELSKDTGKTTMKSEFNMETILKDARLSQFDKQKRYPGGWTEFSLDLAELWYHRCVKASEKHASMARQCRKKFRMVSIPTIVVGTAATALSFFSAGGDSCGSDGEDDNGLKYGIAALTSLVSIMTGINSLYDFNKKTQENILASSQYANLARRTSLQIYLPNESKGQCEVVLTDVSAEYASLCASSPLL